MKAETKTKNTVKTKVEEPKVQKEDPNKVYNILDICEKTKLGNGYLVTKVPDVCTKLLIDDKVIGRGEGRTKKAAEQEAAYYAILEYKNNN